MQLNFLRWHRVVAGFILLVGLVFTGYVAQETRSGIREDLLKDFIAEADEIRLRIEARLQAHQQVLLSGAAMFDASQSVTRAEWRIYTDRLQIDRHFNGIQGLGFSLFIPAEQLAAHQTGIRNEGFPDYAVYPPGKREAYSSIIYLEPFRDRNLRAFGYDMYSEAVRRAAMERARDENIVSLSGKVLLMQETETDVQAGTLMYVPVYHKGMPADTVEQRRAALYGWVYSPFRMNDLLEGVVMRSNGLQDRSVRLRVYDGGDGDDGSGINTRSLLYDSTAGQSRDATGVSLERSIDFGGHVWTLLLEQSKGRLSGADYSKAWLTLWGGVAVSLLLFFLTRSLLNTRRDAERIAAELTSTLRLRDLSLNAAANSFVITDRQGRIEWVNHAYSSLSGYPPEECIGRTPGELQRSGQQGGAFYAQLWQTILGGKVWRGELVNRRKDGSLYDEEMTITPVVDAQGTFTHFVAVKQDITERKRIEQRLQELNRDFVSFLEHTTDFIYFKDADSRIRFCSQTLARITGHGSWRDMIGKHDLEIFPTDTARIYYEEELPIFREGKPLLDKINPYYDESGKQGWVSTNKWPLFDTDNQTITGIFGISRNVTAMVEMQSSLRDSESRFRTLADTVPALIWVSGPDGQCVYVNKVWMAFTGRTLEQELGEGWIEGVHAEDLRSAINAYTMAFDARREVTVEYRLRRFDGEYRWMIDHGVPNIDDEGVFLGFIGSCIDITERHEMEGRIRQLAFCDALTGLPNRRLLHDRLGQLMAAGQRSGHYSALIFLDLDNFKPLNDEYGHEVGDLLLIEVARRLSACVREGDTVARYGGDEFVVVLGELESGLEGARRKAGQVAEKIREVLEKPYRIEVGGEAQGSALIEHHCTSSVGVVMFVGHERSIQDLIEKADAAMYRSKEEGRNRVTFSDDAPVTQ